MTNQRFITILGYVATFTSVCMYVSYLQRWLVTTFCHDDQL